LRTVIDVATIAFLHWRANVVRSGSTLIDVRRGRGNARHETQAGVIRSRRLEHLLVEMDLEITGTKRRQLSKHDVLRNTAAVIHFTNGCRFQENLHSLFEGTAHESTCLFAIDAVSSDGHEVTFGRHDIDQQCQMTMVDI
jgi:hypothetical protein